ncbi:MAG TPA: ABC transporter permease [Thermoanaerobaculia bacterium]|nr:ABC transporter permease [Thermoanaerobaculia bacterium]
MNLWLRFRILLLTLRASRGRSLFAIAAVAMAIAAIMILLSLGTGARLEMEALADRMGRNLFTVVTGRVAVPPGRGTGWTLSTRLERSDVTALEQRIDGIATVVPILEGSRQVRYARREVTTSVRGVPPHFIDVRNFEIADGRPLDERDDAARSRVAVVGPFVAQRLHGEQSLVGETIAIGGIPFEVVGQLAEKGITDGQNEDDQILIPLETARRRVFNADSLSRLLVQAESAEEMEPVRNATRTLLRETHELDEGVRDDFEILSLIRVNEMKRVSSEALLGLAQLFALVTLVVGGAGVLAVTWLNARDRAAEIGLRMAVGARRRDIAALFLAEACALSAAGGIAGLSSGWIAVVVLRNTIGWQMAIDLRGIAIPLGVSLVLGLAFGVIPALRAASVQPVEALRDR